MILLELVAILARIILIVIMKALPTRVVYTQEKMALILALAKILI